MTTTRDAMELIDRLCRRGLRVSIENAGTPDGETRWSVTLYRRQRKVSKRFGASTLALALEHAGNDARETGWVRPNWLNDGCPDCGAALPQDGSCCDVCDWVRED